MKKLISGVLLVGMMTSVHARSPKLNTTMELLNDCMTKVQVPLCDAHYAEMVSELKKVNMDARGEFVYVLKDILAKKSSKEVVVNLYDKLKVLAPVYEQLDGTSVWSGRDILELLGHVSVEYIKYVTLDAKSLEDLFAQQATQDSRYRFLGAVHQKSAKLNDQADIEEMIAFGQFAKDFVKSNGDEYYLYESAVKLVKDMTIKKLVFVRGFEGVYDIELVNADAQKTLKIDNLVISSSDNTNGLVVNFVSSQYRATKFSFKGAGLLGSTAFSNEKVYADTNVLVSPGFEFDINFDATTVKGTFFSKRFGSVEFIGKQKASNAQFYVQPSRNTVDIKATVGNYPVKVGNYAMTLKIEKMKNGYELSLINNNALLVFPKVSYNAKFGVIKALDWKLEKVLELKVDVVNGEVAIEGQFTNGATANVLEVHN